MRQYAVFVDAGYLCMAGGTLVSGKLISRRHVCLEIAPLLEKLQAEAHDLTDGRPLLRVYWYDACPGGTRKSAEHSVIERQDNVKLCLGTINREGRQKGVDTMLVLDLVELAQNRAITDAIIVGGDEDLRGGITRAQALGVRVHLIGIDGIEPNQSSDLIAEADRTRTWDKACVAGFISVKPEAASSCAPADECAEQAEEPTDPLIIQAAQEAATRAELRDVILYWRVNERGLPGDIDGRLLASARNLLGRNLDTHEKRALRAIHTNALKERVKAEMPKEIALQEQEA